MKQISDSEKLFKEIAKILPEIPANVVKLTITIELDELPRVDVSFYPTVIGDPDA